MVPRSHMTQRVDSQRDPNDNLRAEAPGRPVTPHAHRNLIAGDRRRGFLPLLLNALRLAY
jgi:hypothetical protein